MIRSRNLVLCLALVVVVPGLPALHAAAGERARKPRAASTVDPRDGRYQRLRTTDVRLRRMIDEGRATSATFRTLVERLEQSDVVVYIQCDGPAQTRVAGRLTFITAAAGLRYVLVRLAHFSSHPQQIAILAHELQHASEIAETPAIVDEASLAREYSRLGHLSRMATATGIAFDTVAAIQMGQRVLNELIALRED